jgi:hypothetical protein
MNRFTFLVFMLLPVSVIAGGPVVNFISHDDLVSTVFPASSEVSQQQISIDDSMCDWVEKRFRFRPKPQVVTVWLARDRASGKLLGGLIKPEVYYQDSPVTLALGLSDELRVSRAAVVALPEHLRQAFKTSIGVGYLTRYTMMSVRQLSYLANVLRKEGQPSALVAEQLFRSGALLAAVINTTQ